MGDQHYRVDELLKNKATTGEGEVQVVGWSTGTVEVSDTFTGTVQFEAQCFPGGTWAAIACTPLAGGSAVTSTSAPGIWRFDPGGCWAFRTRVSAISSGQVDSRTMLT